MSHPSSPDQFSDFRQALGSICKKKLVEEVDKLKAAVEKDNPDPQEVIMAIPMLLALTICPAMLGTQEAIRSSQSKTKREEHRGRRCNLIVSCVKPSIRSRDVNNKLVVLKDSKLYIANETALEDEEPVDSISNGYPFSGYFLPYPDSEYEGLVSTISDDPPMLNWIYVDKDTYEVKYGVRLEAQENITGPFDCTKQDRRMTLEGWEGFVAVEEIPGIWAVYYDRDDDGLRSKVPLGTRVLEVELIRREKKERKPEPEDQPTTLEEMMKQHKAKTQQEEQDREQFLSPEQQALAQAASDSEESTQAKAAALKEALERLKLGNPTLIGALQSSIDAGSVRTNQSSTWSDTEKRGDADDSMPGTMASSVMDQPDAPASVFSSSDDGMYKKPYVEEDS